MLQRERVAIVLAICKALERRARGCPRAEPSFGDASSVECPPYVLEEAKLHEEVRSGVYPFAYTYD